MPGRVVPAAGDQRQDAREHSSLHRDLCHLEGHTARVSDDLRSDLDQLLAYSGQRPRSAVLGIASVRMKFPRL
jgi:hypothetical protein